MADSEEQFAVLYRWTVDPDHTASFVERWHRGTLRLRDEHGSLGSCLTRAENGDFVAFARWRDEGMRAAAFAAIRSSEPWNGVLQFEETKLAVIDDLLTRP